MRFGGLFIIVNACVLFILVGNLFVLLYEVCSRWFENGVGWATLYLNFPREKENQFTFSFLAGILFYRFSFRRGELLLIFLPGRKIDYVIFRFSFLEGKSPFEVLIFLPGRKIINNQFPIFLVGRKIINSNLPFPSNKENYKQLFFNFPCWKENHK